MLLPDGHPVKPQGLPPSLPLTTGICVVCTTQSYDMTLHSHHNALSSPNGLHHRTRNSICVLLLLTLQLSRCLVSNEPSRYSSVHHSSVHRRAFRATPP